MDRALALAAGSAAAGLSSFSTLLLRGSEGALAHLAENATWGLVIGAVVLALLAADGAKSDLRVKALVALGILAAGLRGALLFAVSG